MTFPRGKRWGGTVGFLVAIVLVQYFFSFVGWGTDRVVSSLDEARAILDRT
jgi:hypothetical protein